MHDAQSRDLVTGHLDQVVGDTLISAFGAQRAPLDEDFLLLSDSSLHQPKPADNIPVTGRELVRFTDPD